MLCVDHDIILFTILTDDCWQNRRIDNKEIILWTLSVCLKVCKSGWYWTCLNNVIVQIMLNGGINKPTFQHYFLLQDPEEESNAETSVYLYHHQELFQQKHFTFSIKDAMQSLQYCSLLVQYLLDKNNNNDYMLTTLEMKNYSWCLIWKMHTGTQNGTKTTVLQFIPLVRVY